MQQQKQKAKDEAKQGEAQIPAEVPVIDSGDITARLEAAAVEEETDYSAMDDGSALDDGGGDCGCW